MFEAQIAKGVQYLDADLGMSWPEKINIQRLELNSCYRCLIGQLYGSYYCRFDGEDGVEDGMEFGFSTDNRDRYPVLEREWKEKIIQLKAERGSSTK